MRVLLLYFLHNTYHHLVCYIFIFTGRIPPLECKPQESKELTFPVHYYNPSAKNNNGYGAGTQIFIKRIHTGYLALL